MREQGADANPQTTKTSAEPAAPRRRGRAGLTEVRVGPLLKLLLEQPHRFPQPLRRRQAPARASHVKQRWGDRGKQEAFSK